MSAVHQLAEQLAAVFHQVATEAADAAAAKVLVEAKPLLEQLAARAAAPPVLGPAPRETMSIADVCTDFEISERTLWEWRRDPEDPFPAPRKYGPNTVRFERSEVNEWRARRPPVILRRPTAVSRRAG